MNRNGWVRCVETYPLSWNEQCEHLDAIDNKLPHFHWAWESPLHDPWLYELGSPRKLIWVVL